MKEALLSLFSGIIGVILTIGYQHFFIPDPTIIVNIDGKEEKVTSEKYEELIVENESLKTNNEKYQTDLAEANKKLEELQINNLPTINYYDLTLSIDGEDIQINKSNSMITVDGRDYISKEIAEKLISDNQNFTIKDDTLYIGKIVADKASLFDQTIMDQFEMYMTDATSDSYGNSYRNVLTTSTFYSGQRHVIFVLNKKYSLLKFKIAIGKYTSIESSGIITIKADDDIIYTSKELNKKTEPFTEVDIPINNCNLLTIEYNSGDTIDCIISDAMVYN